MEGNLRTVKVMILNDILYEEPEIDEEHDDSELTNAEIKAMQKKEEKFQKKKKRKLAEQREEAKSKRAMLRVNKL